MVNSRVAQDANQVLFETFQYDDLNRLTGTAVYTGASVSGNSCAGGSTINTLGLGYDAMGNIQNRTVNDTVETYTPDPNHPYAVGLVTNMGDGTYTASYDADGNMTSRNGYQIQWTPSNLPSSMGSALGSSTFSYDPDHARYYQVATLKKIGVRLDCPNFVDTAIGAAPADYFRASASRYFSASNAAMQPLPAEVTAWRYT